METNTLSNKKMKDSWSSYTSSQSYGEDSNYLGGFSWPPRSYTCSFCKREFRSAQALGGHMNVHRRDRARLRQSPPGDINSHHHCPPLNLNLTPNPNPNFSTCTLPATSLVSPPLFATSSPSFVSHTGEIKKWQVGGANSSPQGCLSLKNMENRQSLLAPTGFDHDFMAKKNGCKLLKKAKILRLDLEIGSLVSDPNEDLDLELRLGYS